MTTQYRVTICCDFEDEGTARSFEKRFKRDFIEMDDVLDEMGCTNFDSCIDKVDVEDVIEDEDEGTKHDG